MISTRSMRIRGRDGARRRRCDRSSLMSMLNRASGNVVERLAERAERWPWPRSICCSSSTVRSPTRRRGPTSRCRSGSWLIIATPSRWSCTSVSTWVAPTASALAGRRGACSRAHRRRARDARGRADQDVSRYGTPLAHGSGRRRRVRRWSGRCRRSGDGRGRAAAAPGIERRTDALERLGELARDDPELVRLSPRRASGRVCRYWYASSFGSGSPVVDGVEDRA